METTRFGRLQNAVNITNIELAELLNVNKRTITKWRTGEVEAPTTVILIMKSLASGEPIKRD